ncbi:MAG: hypothetical protein J5476_08635 [Lachnospiraceae bacterium]|nr:hypothetical protein [Lachnospiraceae bacterium]
MGKADSCDFVKQKVTELLRIVDELEDRFPGKKFTLDGHLLGSMGEVLAEYYYQIKPYRNSAKTHDGEVGGKRVQVKITQGDSVDINDVPDYLLVLFLNKKDGSVYEVYNGPCEWLRDCKRTKNGWYSRTLNKLAELDKSISDDCRLESVKTIKKWSSHIKNS